MLVTRFQEALYVAPSSWRDSLKSMYGSFFRLSIVACTQGLHKTSGGTAATAILIVEEFYTSKKCPNCEILLE